MSKASRLVSALLIIGSMFLSTAQAGAAPLRFFGLFAGANFPRFFVGKAQFNFTDEIALDVQGSLGTYWTTEQADLLYFFSRSEWALYSGAGFQIWQFKGITFGNDSSFLAGSGDNASSVTIPLGLQYVDDSGFSLDVNLALDVFTSGFSGLKSRIIPEAQISVGAFF